MRVVNNIAAVQSTYNMPMLEFAGHSTITCQFHAPMFKPITGWISSTNKPVFAETYSIMHNLALSRCPQSLVNTLH